MEPEPETREVCKLLDELIRANSQVGLQLGKALDLPLRAYLKGLIPPAEPESSNPHRQLVADAFRWQLNQWGCAGVEEICAGLLQYPVIQMADHSNLLFDEETFLNNYLFHLACRENNLRNTLNWQCSTVSCLSRRQPIAGPVFLRTRGDLYKVFPISNRSLERSNFCGLLSSLPMSFELLEGSGAGRRDPFLRRFMGRTFSDSPEAYRICNEEIWDALSMPDKTRRVAVDDSLGARIVAGHLENPDSPVTRLMFDEHVRDTFLAHMREMVAGREFFAVNRPTPDFLWYRRGSRLVPVVMVGKGKSAMFQLESSQPEFPIPFTRRSLADAMRGGLLYPSKFLNFFVRCLLPEIVAVGGTVQQDYVAMYQELLARTNHDAPFLNQREIKSIERSGASRLGGAPLLEMNTEQKRIVGRLGPDTDFDEFERSFIDQPIRETIGDLECASFYYKEFEKKAAAGVHEHTGN